MDKCSKARGFALDAYGSEEELDHPNDVCRLVTDVGADDDLRTAAILHDLIEDTDVEIGEIAAEFGSRVAAYVSAMTEDESLEDYTERKEEHRRRACAAGREVALLFVADKLSNARRMLRGQKKPSVRKLGHYGATLQTMGAAYPDLPLLDKLDHELQTVRAELQRTTTA
jgi:hypothetical protein